MGVALDRWSYHVEMESLYFLLAVVIHFTLVATEPRDLTSSEFKSRLASGDPTFVKFFAPWCGHCLKLAPTWEKLSEVFENTSILIAKVDCAVETAVCSEEGVRGYPTLKLYTGTLQVPYTGHRDLSSLEDFVNQQTTRTEGDEVGLVELDGESFAPFLEKDGSHFIKFYAPWCGHCQKLAPIWDKLANFYKSDPSVHIGKIDCTRFTELCTKYGIQGYPTLLIFGGGIVLDKYNGDRTLSSLIQFVRDQIGSTDEVEEEKPKNKGYAAEPLMLTADNFDLVIKDGLIFVKFFAPWCGHCKQMAPTWDELAAMAHATTHTTIAKVDCTIEKELCERYNIDGYPTLVLFSDGSKKTEYKKARDLESLMDFLKEHE